MRTVLKVRMKFIKFTKLRFSAGQGTIQGPAAVGPSGQWLPPEMGSRKEQPAVRRVLCLGTGSSPGGAGDLPAAC